MDKGDTVYLLSNVNTKCVQKLISRRRSKMSSLKENEAPEVAEADLSASLGALLMADQSQVDDGLLSQADDGVSDGGTTDGGNLSETSAKTTDGHFNYSDISGSDKVGVSFQQ